MQRSGGPQDPVTAAVSEGTSRSGGSTAGAGRRHPERHVADRARPYRMSQTRSGHWWS